MEPAIDLPAVEYAERSDPGRDPTKQVNEDACGHRETRLGHLCVVCDGMGGHASGREAAELALATIFETFEHAPEGAAPQRVLRSAIEEASRRVFAMVSPEVSHGRPGSTVVAVLMHAHGTEVAHVGDSRAYLVHEGQIFRVTRDHSIVQELVDRHPGLRTTFEERDGALLQRVHERPPLPFEVVDASAWGEEELHRRLEDEAHRPFDLERGPLVRMHLFRIASDDHIFLLTVHHIVGDFWSLVLVLEEMQALYRGHLQRVVEALGGTMPPQPQGPAQG